MPAPPAEEVQAQLQEAQRHLEHREAEQAILCYRKVLVASPSFEAQFGLAQGELLAGRDEVALSEFQRALQLDANDPATLLELARLESRKASAFKQAEIHYSRYLSLRPSDTQAEIGFARLLVWEGHSAAAAEIFSKPEVKALMGAQDQRDYAFALAASAKKADAEPLLSSLLKNQPSDDQAALQLAGLKAARGEWESALPMYESVLERHPEDHHLQLTVGQGLIAQGHKAEALPYLEKAARGLPEDGEAALAYGRTLRAMGDLKGAGREFDRAISHYRDDASVNREYADLLLERRDFGKAATHYRRAMQLGLQDDRVIVSLATALAANDKPREAIPLYEDLERRQPSDRTAYELAKLYRRVGRNDEALALLKTIRTSPNP